MPVEFNVIERGEPGVPGGGVKKFYASAITTGESNIERLTTQIEKISTVSGADIRAVLYSLVDVITDELSYGRIVRLGDLGSLRISISSEGKDTPAEVDSSSIKSAKYIFSPGSRLKMLLPNLKYKKA